MRELFKPLTYIYSVKEGNGPPPSGGRAVRGGELEEGVREEEFDEGRLFEGSVLK